MSSKEYTLEIPSVTSHQVVLDTGQGNNGEKSKLWNWILSFGSPNDPSGLEGISKCLRKVQKSLDMEKFSNNMF